MAILKIFLISVILVGFVIGAMAIKLIFNKNAHFTGGTCRTSYDDNSQQISCGCDSQNSCITSDKK